MHEIKCPPVASEELMDYFDRYSKQAKDVRDATRAWVAGHLAFVAALSGFIGLLAICKICQPTVPPPFPIAMILRLSGNGWATLAAVLCVAGGMGTDFFIEKTSHWIVTEKFNQMRWRTIVGSAVAAHPLPLFEPTLDRSDTRTTEQVDKIARDRTLTFVWVFAAILFVGVQIFIWFLARAR